MPMSRPPRAASTLAAFLSLLAAGTAIAAPQSLSGTVTYLERMALPPEATVTVQLLDVSLADAPARVLAQTILSPGGQVPLPYRLDYDDAEVRPGHSYAVAARIMLGEELLFVTATHHPVLTGGESAADIVLERAAPALPAAPTGQWLAQSIRGEGLIEGVETDLEIAEDGTISSSGGCNRVMGSAQIDGQDIAFGQLAATRMSCPPAVMAQERGFLAALSEARSWDHGAEGGTLRLLSGSGDELMVLRRR